MTTTSQFFSRLRRLAASLETDAAQLQQDFENRHEDDEERTARAMRTYHQLGCDVTSLEEQVRDDLTKQKMRENEVSSFIQKYRKMERKVAEDIKALRAHWEKYGYQAPRDHLATEAGGPDVEAAGEDCAGEEEPLEEAGTSPSSAWPVKVGRPPAADSMPSPAPPRPLTPKCALKMEEDELLRPQMENFGIAENTVCLSSDFTMELFQKKKEKPLSRPGQKLHAQEGNSLADSLQTKADSFQSAETPELSKPKKIKMADSSPPSPGDQDLRSRGGPASIPSTPEMPTFESAFMRSLWQNVRPSTLKDTQPDDEYTFDLRTPTSKLTTGTKMWEYNVPEITIPGMEDVQMPETPIVEPAFGTSSQFGNAKVPKEVRELRKESQLADDTKVEVDEPTQELGLGTPRVRREFLEILEPNSVSQDFSKLSSQAQVKKTTEQEKENSSFPTVGTLSLVSESEFQSLPSYMKLMALHDLNQAIHNINAFTTQSQGDKREFPMEELGKIINVGLEAPIYIVCLNELQRLQLLRETGTTSLYKINLT